MVTDTDHNILVKLIIMTRNNRIDITYNSLLLYMLCSCMHGLLRTSRSVVIIREHSRGINRREGLRLNINELLQVLSHVFIVDILGIIWKGRDCWKGLILDYLSLQLEIIRIA